MQHAPVADDEVEVGGSFGVEVLQHGGLSHGPDGGEC
jgi:hypothetical protein